MQEIRQNNPLGGKYDSSVKLLPVLAIWLSVIVFGGLYLLLDSDDLNPIKQYFLVPWVLLTGAVIAVPLTYYWHRGRFNISNPLIYAACAFFLPAFVFGGFVLANGWSEPYFLVLIQDPQTDLPFTMIVIMLGFLGLAAGFMLPLGNFAGNKIGAYLPKAEWEEERLFTACYVLLGVGIVNTILGYVSGILGYQKLEEVGVFDGILFLMTLIWMESTFLMCLLVFHRAKYDAKAITALSITFFFALVKAIYAGNRGGLFAIAIMAFLAYILARRKVTLKLGMIGGGALVAALFLGMIYGTTFRSVKETESRVGIEQYTENIFSTFNAVSESDNLKTLEQGFLGLAERIDAVSSLAVVVSNYEQLAPYEESYGLDNNIWKDVATFFIPRVVWNDKPIASEPRKYSELYFNYGENSFAITPMGDLLRNYGTLGVFLGMLLLGLFLRTLYSALIEDKEFSYWKTTFYYMILTAVSYEAFYGSIISYVSKVAVVSIIGLLIVALIMRNKKASANVGKIVYR